jgi:hypothetical protein
VTLDYTPFRLGQPPGLDQDLPGDPDLAEVVQQRRESDAPNRAAAELEILGQGHRENRHVGGVRRGVLVELLQLE